MCMYVSTGVHIVSPIAMTLIRGLELRLIVTMQDSIELDLLLILMHVVAIIFDMGMVVYVSFQLHYIACNKGAYEVQNFGIFVKTSIST